MRREFTKFHFSFTAIFLLFMALIGCKREESEISRESYTHDIQHYLTSIGGPKGYTDSIFDNIDLGRVKKIKWKNCDLIIAPFKGNTNKRVVNLTLEVKEDRITAADLYEIVATGFGDNAGKQFENFLETKPIDFTGSFKVSNVKEKNFHELLKYRYSNGKIIQAEIVRPDIKKRNLAKERPIGLIASLDDPTETCVTWVRVYYNPNTNEIYNIVYLYTVCDGSGTGGGGGNETTYDYQDPCARAQALKDSTFKEKLGLLKYAAQHMNSESMWIKSNQGGVSTWNLITGNPNEQFVLNNWAAYPQLSLNSIMHNHFTGGLSIFSEGDLKVLWKIVNSNQVSDPATFNFTVITQDQTTYTLQISDVGAFLAWGQNWFDTEAHFEMFKLQYQNLNHILLTNDPATNKENFLTMLRMNNAGLTLLTGNFATLNTWQPSVLNNSGQYITIPCD